MQYNNNGMNGEEIRELRIKLHLSQEEFASKIGVTLNTVCRWENGHMKPSKMAVSLIKYFKEKNGMLEVK